MPIMYNFEEDTNEKLSLICHLSSPKLMHMNLGTQHKVPFIFRIVPSKLCYTHGVEHYLFQWSETNSMSPVNI
jgi:hypothetical protein